MNRPTSWIAVLPSLVIPASLGLTMYLGLSFLLGNGYIANELVVRYLTGHAISHVTVAMFLIGMASLGGIAWNVFAQFTSERRLTFTHVADQQWQVSDSAGDDRSVDETPIGRKAALLQEQLTEMPASIQSHYLWHRLASVLGFIRRNRSVAGVDEELKYLGELDLDRQQQRYALVRILIWATPMLGFLGTVLGISEALGGINVGPDNDFQNMMDGLRGSLYVAFDTTALALTLSMVLMFTQFLVDRFEDQLLTLVDHRARGEISRQFDLASTDPQRETLTREFLQLTQQSAERQIEVWKKTIQHAEQAWTSTLTDANATVQTNLTEALDINVHHLAHYLGEAIEKADEAMSHRWQQWQVTLSDHARAMNEQQKQLTEQSKQLESLIVDQQGSERLEQALRQNQSAISATEELQQTIAQLQASVQAFHDSSSKATVSTGSPAEAQPERETPLQAGIEMAGAASERVNASEQQVQPAPAEIDEPQGNDLSLIEAAENLPGSEKTEMLEDSSSSELQEPVVNRDAKSTEADPAELDLDRPILLPFEPAFQRRVAKQESTPFQQTARAEDAAANRDADVIIRFAPIDQSASPAVAIEQAAQRAAQFLSERKKRPAA